MVTSPPPATAFVVILSVAPLRAALRKVRPSSSVSTNSVPSTPRRDWANAAAGTAAAMDTARPTARRGQSVNDDFEAIVSSLTQGSAASRPSLDKGRETFQRTMTVAPVGKTTAPTAPAETLVARPSRCVPLVASLYNGMLASAPPARMARAAMARTMLRIMVGLFGLQEQNFYARSSSRLIGCE